jgi:hypothetical protein
MWVEVKKASNRMLAEMWKEYIEGEGIPAQIMSQGGEAPDRELVAYRVLVPDDKLHVVEEMLKKL